MSERQIEKTDLSKVLVPISSLDGVVCSSHGDHIAPVYKRVYDEKLKREVVKKTEEIDLFEFIQASKSSTDLATLQQRMISLGEIPNVDPSLGSNDLALFPQDIHGVYDLVNDVDGAFGRLPEQIQKIFGTSDVYLKALLDGSFASVVQAGLAAAAKDKPAKEGEDTPNE